VINQHISLFPACAVLVMLVACTGQRQDVPDPINNSPPNAQNEIRKAVESIKNDIESANIAGLQGMHLASEKFTKFGPRSFDRQDVNSTNRSEAAFFSSISNARYEARDLKVDVFGDIGIATYYPEVSFTRDGESVQVSGRQTLVFLKTGSGWKLVHEHGTIRPQ
jgi:ketosteroid isomerase-like protein